MIKNAFFCENCRRPIESTSQVFYVEDFSDRGFCSEKCIKEFYAPFMRVLEAEEQTFRNELLLDEEDEILGYLGNTEFLEQALKYPDEVWFLKNAVDQKFYTHIKRFDIEGKKISLILICSYIDDGPSFVFYRTVTTHAKLEKKYQREELLDGKIILDDEEGFSETSSPELLPETIEEIELKKSSALAQLLANRSNDDIPFEEFMDFDSFIQITLDHADEIYKHIDDDGDEIFTYIRSFKRQDDTFFYIVLAMVLDQDKHEMVIPILSFPSIDSELYPNYAQGEIVKRKLSN